MYKVELKVGYSTLDVPYAYLNQQGELVGYDIAYAYQLARDLDCSLEFVPIDYRIFEDQIVNGEFDIAMSAIVMNEQRIQQMGFTESYAEESNVLVVPRSRVFEFLNFNKLQKNPQLTLGAGGQYASAAKRHFPSAEIFLADTTGAFSFLLQGTTDAIMEARTSSYIWCLSHPDFTVIDYGNLLGKSYLAYPVPPYHAQWLSFLHHWLELKQQSGFHDQMVRYWIQGEDPAIQPPRWSVIRNVLHWVH